MGHLSFYSPYFLELNISKWNLTTKTLVQINPSNISNKIFFQMASLDTGVLQNCQSIDHCPIHNKFFSATNWKFTYLLAKLLYVGMKLYLNLTYAKYLFIAPLWLNVIAIPKIGCVWDEFKLYSPEYKSVICCYKRTFFWSILFLNKLQQRGIPLRLLYKCSHLLICILLK